MGLKLYILLIYLVCLLNGFSQKYDLVPSTNGKFWGYKNLNNELVIDYLYDSVSRFYHHSAFVFKNGDRKKIDENGHEILDPITNLTAEQKKLRIEDIRIFNKPHYINFKAQIKVYSDGTDPFYKNPYNALLPIPKSGLTDSDYNFKTDPIYDNLIAYWNSHMPRYQTKSDSNFRFLIKGFYFVDYKPKGYKINHLINPDGEVVFRDSGQLGSYRDFDKIEFIHTHFLKVHVSNNIGSVFIMYLSTENKNQFEKVKIDTNVILHAFGDHSMLAVKKVGNRKYYGLYNSELQEITPPIHRKIEGSEIPFTYIASNKTGEKIIIDYQGNDIFKGQYILERFSQKKDLIYAYNKSFDLCLLQWKSNQLTELFNFEKIKHNDLIFLTKYSHETGIPSHYIYTRKGKKGLKTKTGEILIPAHYTSFNFFPFEAIEKIFIKALKSNELTYDLYTVEGSQLFKNKKLSANRNKKQSDEFYFRNSFSWHPFVRPISWYSILKVGREVGVINEKGDFLVPPIYDSIFGQRTMNNFLVAWKNREIHIINKRGENVKTFYKTKNVSQVWLGKYLDQFNTSEIKLIVKLKNEKYALMDSTRIISGNYDHIHYSGTGLFMTEENGLGMIDVNGTEIIPAIYDYCKPRNGSLIYCGKDKKLALRMYSGQVILPLQKLYVSDYNKSSDTLKIISENTIYYLSKASLKIIDTIKFDSIVFKSQKLSWKLQYQNYFLKVYKNNQSFIWSVIEGRKVLELSQNLTAYKRISYGLFIVTINGKTGVVNYDGEVIVPIEYDNVKQYDILLEIQNNGRILGYYDKDGNKYFENDYDSPPINPNPDTN